MTTQQAYATYKKQVKELPPGQWEEWIKVIRHVLYTGGHECYFGEYQQWVRLLYNELKKNEK
jgi:hypothetical protein